MIPTLGSKEAIFTFALAVVDADGARDTVAYTDPGYPVYERGALFAHARPLAIPLREEHGFLPDLDAIDDETWARLAVFWVNYPNNPTCATAPLSFYERLAGARARARIRRRLRRGVHRALVRRAARLGAAARRPDATCVVFNTLSKRSSMTGYRSGFAAGDPALVAALKAFRPTVGTAPQEFVQRASVVAWGDEEHVAATRERYGRKRALLLDVLRRKGIRVAGSEATMYLWLAVPEGETSESFAERLLEHGILRRARLVPRRRGRGLRRGSRSSPPRRSAPAPPRSWSACCDARAGARRSSRRSTSGERRVAAKQGDEWVVDVEAKEAILEYFRHPEGRADRRSGRSPSRTRCR